MNKTLSIIIPCYNVAAYVQAALESVLDNLSPEHDSRVEIILVNDGSTDQTDDIIKKFIQQQLIRRFITYHYIEQANAGLSAARNAGMAQATGEYWLFLDSDDFFYNQSLNKIIAAIDRYAPDIIEFDATKWTEGEFATQSLYQNYFFTHDIPNTRTYCLEAFHANLWYVWSRCYHKKLFENQIFELGKFFEDMMTIPYVYLAAKHIFRLPESLLAYRQRPASILATLSHRHLDHLFWGIQKAMSLEEQYSDFKEEIKLLQYKNWRLIVAESIKIFLRTGDFSYLYAVQNKRAQMRRENNRDYGWQLVYFTQVLLKKYIQKR